MDLLPPLESELQSAFQDAVAKGVTTPVSNLLEVSEESSAGGPHSGQESCWNCTDSTEWSPGLWWLLNWWTALYPAGPELHGDVQSDGGPSQAINQSSSPGREDDAIQLAPALADLGDDHHEYGPPPPPIPREVVEQLVSRGEGIVDLLA